MFLLLVVGVASVLDVGWRRIHIVYAVLILGSVAFNATQIAIWLEMRPPRDRGVEAAQRRCMLPCRDLQHLQHAPRPK
eukprot:6183506-Pleurochrysis_carterae.AAC.2